MARPGCLARPHRRPVIAYVSTGCQVVALPRQSSAGVRVQAFDAGGGMRWEVRHSCWEGPCLRQHTAYEVRVGERAHRYPEHGSACVSAECLC